MKALPAKRLPRVAYTVAQLEALLASGMTLQQVIAMGRMAQQQMAEDGEFRRRAFAAERTARYRRRRAGEAMGL